MRGPTYAFSPNSPVQTETLVGLSHAAKEFVNCLQEGRSRGYIPPSFLIHIKMFESVNRTKSINDILMAVADMASDCDAEIFKRKNKKG